jgi:hypothetical protein
MLATLTPGKIISWEPRHGCGVRIEYIKGIDLKAGVSAVRIH